MQTTLRERLDAKIDRSAGPNACWPWTAYRDPQGYGRIARNGKSDRAHRVSYELAVGPIPEGLHVDHLCGNRWCVNPRHLEPVTQWENMVRGGGATSVVNAAKTHCKDGHPLAGDNVRITSQGGRQCISCWKVYQKTYYDTHYSSRARSTKAGVIPAPLTAA
jgi:hypothetical protein